MDIVKGFPPNYEKICKVFPEVRNDKRVVFTYGDVFYNPGGDVPNPDLCVHEEMHMRQQKGFLGAWRWWRKYLRNPKFRLSQELEAYQEQYKFLKSTLRNRNELSSALLRIARHLSSPIYGELITTSKAIELIKGL